MASAAEIQAMSPSRPHRADDGTPGQAFLARGQGLLTAKHHRLIVAPIKLGDRMAIGKIWRPLIAFPVAWALGATGAEARFLQTDPVGYQDNNNLYCLRGE